MDKQFLDPVTEINTFTDARVLIYSSSGLCQTSEELLSSSGFQLVLEQCLKKMIFHQSPILECLQEFLTTPQDKDNNYDIKKIIFFLKQLLVKQLFDIPPLKLSELKSPSRDSVVWKDFIEELYAFWRKRERFIIFENPADNQITGLNVEHEKFIKENEQFKSLVLTTYRQICANITGDLFYVYRQLPVGGHIHLSIRKINWKIPGSMYQKLLDIPMIQMVLMFPPIIYYTKSSKRTGKFDKLKRNPVEFTKLDSSKWLCYPAKVGPLLIFIYFHKDFMGHVAGLSNLFELARIHEIENKQPDGIMLFGVDASIMDNANVGYWEDAPNRVVVGSVSYKNEVDYFGYFKKTALTIHNLIMISRGRLPIHGAMAKIDLKSGKSAHVVLMGDSGAGKSESLEAFRVLAEQYIRQLTIIFDDMGSLGIMPDGQITAWGTEIGAFIRLDDLTPGYAYTEIDRAIFMNPNLKNARLVLPITEYRQIITGYPVDMFLYANNYDNVDDEHPHLEIITDKKNILEIFSSGARLAKGTTDEMGISHTYFANPFGAIQKREAHQKLADQMVDQFLKLGKPVGQLRTQLGIAGFEMSGPQQAAKALFQYISTSL